MGESQSNIAFADRVRSAVYWRAGSQIAAQLVMWSATVLVVRLLDPHDYGLFAMSQVVLVAFNFLNGYSYATSLIQAESVSQHRIAQVFGMLLLLNGSLALAQLIIAPLAAEYYHQPIIADMLRVQALLFLTTPFIALPSALLARQLDFKKQGWINLGATLSGACLALTLAYSGFGVWTLVIAPIFMFTVRAIGLTIAARLLVWPSFDFRGSGDVVRFGTALLISQLFWILQSQSDIFIAGRILNPHDLGLYSESLFLTLIFTGRFIPPLNEVALPAYAEMMKQGRPVGPAFVTAIRLVMLLAAPLYVGLAMVAGPLVGTVFGPKWLEMIPIVSGLALAMPCMALQIICSPATNAMARPRIYLKSSIAGAIIMPIGYLIGIRWGAQGLVHAWQICAPLLLAVTLWLTLPVVRTSLGELAAALRPVAVATTVMAATVYGLSLLVPHWAYPRQLALLVVAGVATYGLTLQLVWPQLVRDVIDIVKKRRASLPVPDDQTTTTAASGAA
jgi:O-antigen/teichoic acid export membrane protein